MDTKCLENRKMGKREKVLIFITHNTSHMTICLKEVIVFNHICSCFFFIVCDFSSHNTAPTRLNVFTANEMSNVYDLKLSGHDTFLPLLVDTV